MAETGADIDTQAVSVMHIEKARPSTSAVIASAENLLNSRFPLITDKGNPSPSGDKRDFVSLSPYWFRIDDRLEYRDGEVNPEVQKYPDSENFTNAVVNIYIPSLAARSVESPAEKQKFAQRAVAALRAWFVDKGTRMTPSFEYAEVRQGEAEGIFTGIITGNRLIYVIEAVNYLREEKLIDLELLEGVENWFDQYLNWLLTSEKAVGKKNSENEEERMGEKGMVNNHGTSYDVQVAYIADFLGKSDLAKGTIDGVKERIKSQVKPDGEMPLEAGRPLSSDYQLYNLYAFSLLARLGQRYDTDLWHWESEDGKSLQKAFAYFSDKLKNAGARPFKMDRSGELHLAFRAASLAYGNTGYWDLPRNYYKEDQLADEISQMALSQK